jgi:hypothetical protein
MEAPPGPGPSSKQLSRSKGTTHVHCPCLLDPVRAARGRLEQTDLDSRCRGDQLISTTRFGTHTYRDPRRDRPARGPAPPRAHCRARRGPRHSTRRRRPRPQPGGRGEPMSASNRQSAAPVQGTGRGRRTGDARTRRGAAPEPRRPLSRESRRQPYTLRKMGLDLRKLVDT